MLALGTLGTPFRVVYMAKNFVSDLQNIEVKIIRPNGSMTETQSMTEFTDPILFGVYYYDFVTTENDPVGDYIVIIHNPEQGLKEGFRINYKIGNFINEIEENYLGE